MRVSKINRRMFIVLCMLFIWGTYLKPASAAMDPEEVKRLNEAAPYQLVGTVIADEFYQDMTRNDKHPIQLRKMKMEVSEVIKAPDDAINNNIVEVYYTHIPSWDVGEYVGGKRMDIALGDVLTIWLEKGDYGWEPVLGGDSVAHIYYSDDREEHIPEPLLHSILRGLDHVMNMKLDIFIFGGLVLVIAWAVFRGLRKTI